MLSVMEFWHFVTHNLDVYFGSSVVPTAFLEGALSFFLAFCCLDYVLELYFVLHNPLTQHGTSCRNRVVNVMLTMEEGTSKMRIWM